MFEKNSGWVMDCQRNVFHVLLIFAPPHLPLTKSNSIGCPGVCSTFYESLNYSTKIPSICCCGQPWVWHMFYGVGLWWKFDYSGVHIFYSLVFLFHFDCSYFFLPLLMYLLQQVVHVSTALATFACKCKPLMVGLYLNFALNGQISISVSHPSCRVRNL